MSGRREWHLLSPFETLGAVAESTPTPWLSCRGGSGHRFPSTHLQGRAASPFFPPVLRDGPKSRRRTRYPEGHLAPAGVKPERTPPSQLPEPRSGGGAQLDTGTAKRRITVKLGGASLHSRRRGGTAPDAGSGTVGPSRPSSRQKGSSPYLSSETLMTPSSLGTITAIFTTSWDPSIRCSRIGLRVRGLGWISAAIGGGGAPGAPPPIAPRGRAEETAGTRTQVETETLAARSGTPETGEHSLASSLGNDSALPASGTKTATTGMQAGATTREGGGEPEGRSLLGGACRRGVAAGGREGGSTSGRVVKEEGKPGAGGGDLVTQCACVSPPRSFSPPPLRGSPGAAAPLGRMRFPFPAVFSLPPTPKV